MQLKSTVGVSVYLMVMVCYSITMEIISTRTPEGEPIRCSVCQQQTNIVSSIFPIYDATCPFCGQHLIMKGTEEKKSIKVDMKEALSWCDEQIKVLKEQTEVQEMPVIPERVELRLSEVTNPLEIERMEATR